MCCNPSTGIYRAVHTTQNGWNQDHIWPDFYKPVLDYWNYGCIKPFYSHCLPKCQKAIPFYLSNDLSKCPSGQNEGHCYVVCTNLHTSSSASLWEWNKALTLAHPRSHLSVLLSRCTTCMQGPFCPVSQLHCALCLLLSVYTMCWMEAETVSGKGVPDSSKLRVCEQESSRKFFSNGGTPFTEAALCSDALEGTGQTVEFRCRGKHHAAMKP